MGIWINSYADLISKKKKREKIKMVEKDEILSQYVVCHPRFDF